MNLIAYWFNFSSISPYNSLRLGCGVTAHNYNDALSILKDTIFSGEEVPEIVDVIEDIDISTLDEKHVIPNMESPVWRGVWFPKGYVQL